MTVAYERLGAGEPLVLLHGIGHRWQAWRPVLDHLAAHHDVLALDLPGFGASPVPRSGLPHGFQGAVAAVADALADLGVARPHVAGNSLGGAIALELAMAGLARSATALSPAGFYTRPEIALGLGALHALHVGTRLPEPLLRKVFAFGPTRALAFWPLVAHPGRVSAEDALGDALAMRNGAAFVAVAKGGWGYAFRPPPATPDVPVTVAWGTRDRILPYRQAARARARLPRAHHVDLPGCGHVPMLDDPALVAEVILATTSRAASCDGQS